MIGLKKDENVIMTRCQRKQGGRREKDGKEGKNTDTHPSPTTIKGTLNLTNPGSLSRTFRRLNLMLRNYQYTSPFLK